MPMQIMNGADLKGQRIINLGDATNPTDAINLGQVQAFLRGLRWKEPVRAASTANVSLTAPGTTLDGVTLAVNDRILLKNQTNPQENGIYVWAASATALTRSLDADSAAELIGATVTVTEGNQVASATPAGYQVYTQTVDTITLNTTPLTWAIVGGGTVAYTNGLGLDLTGSSFSVKVGNGILVDANGVKVDPAIVARKYSQTVGGSTTVTIASATHNLGTAARVDAVVDISTGLTEYPDISYPPGAPGDITITWAVAPAASSKRIDIRG